MYYITLSIWFFLLSGIWALFSGIIEGILYSERGADAFKGNEHHYFDVQRMSIGCLIVVSFFLHRYLNDKEFMMLLISSLLSWNFFHDAGYYQTRYFIDTPAYKWYSDSTTSSAKLNFSFKTRLLLFLIGLIFLILPMCIK